MKFRKIKTKAGNYEATGGGARLKIGSSADSFKEP